MRATPSLLEIIHNSAAYVNTKEMSLFTQIGQRSLRRLETLWKIKFVLQPLAFLVLPLIRYGCVPGLRAQPPEEPVV